MPFDQQNSEDYPLDEDSMRMVLEMAGWKYVTEQTSHFLLSDKDERYRVPADEHGRTVTNAFTMFLWLTKNPRSK